MAARRREHVGAPAEDVLEAVAARAIEHRHRFVRSLQGLLVAAQTR